VKSLRSRDGYALIVAIMIVFVVMLLIASFTLYLKNRSRRLVHLQEQIQAFYNAESGLAKALWYMSSGEDVVFNVDPSGTKTKIDTLFENPGSTASVSIENRGFFTEITSEGKEGRFTERVRAKIGCINRGIFDNACNVLSPGILHVKGRVEGDIETRGSVDGNVYGEVTQNLSLSFPRIEFNTVSSKIAGYRALIENPAQADTELFGPFVVDEESDFLNRDLVYVNDVVLIENHDYMNPLTIEGNSVIVSPDEIQISGNVRLSGIDFISNGRILVAGESMLKDVVLYSENEIELREHAQVEGTILTKGSIKACEDVKVSGNSVILSNSDRDKIELDDRTNISGIIILCPKVGLGKTVTSHIVVDEDAKVKGLIYTTTCVRLKGTVTGTVYTPTFVGEPLYPDTSNMNVLEGEVVSVREKDMMLPLVFTGLPKKVFSWEKE
jgi:cytoskeletal protein CcmA (bactofilin family)